MSKTVPTEEIQPIRIQLLGGFCVTVGARVIAEAEWRRRKAKSLIKLLALAHAHRLHREQVMDRLWPELDLKAAANNLHQLLYIARRILDPTGRQTAGYLQLQAEVLSLYPEKSLWVDVNAFEEAASVARRSQTPAAYRAALDLYTGHLLPEDHYDDWLSNRREKLRQEYLQLLLDLAQRLESRHEVASAIQTLQQLLADDPAHEEAHAGLMRLYALAGQRQQALRQYQLLQEALRRELEAEPEPHHQRLYQDILAGHFGPKEPGIEDPESRMGDGERANEDDVTLTPAARPPASLHNLPSPLTRFIGREPEKAEVRQLQATTRLLTLTGPGGCGKSRLALEVATELHAAQAYPDGIWLVELAALSDPGLVPQAAASALGVQETPGQALAETLLEYLQLRQLLLVLDNCEHLIEACARLAGTLLPACPGLHILATSREPLHIPGELTWTVPSLSLPDPQNLPPLATLLQCEAIQLFVDRATAVLPTFTVSQYNATDMAQICFQLDGLPLAIELAAARVKLLTVAQIASRLEDRFRLLVGGSRLALSRQQTLKATLDWSYELLSEPERALFRRLAVFAGDFSLEAPEGICAGEGLDPPDVLNVLSQLVDKSLVVVREAGQERRYGLLETVQHYSAEKLRASGEETKLRRQHQAWYLALAAAVEPGLYGSRQAEWLGRLEMEHDNLRAVLAWSKTEASEPWLGLRLARALFWFWYQRRYLSEGRAEFKSALAQTEPGQRTWVRATALYGSGALAMYQGDLTTARHHLTESIAIWRELDNEVELAMALLSLGTVAINQGDEHAAGPLLEECLPLFKKLGQDTRYAITLTHLGDVALVHGDWAAARVRYEEALALQRAMGHQWGTAQALNNLGEVARCENDYSRAAWLYQESLALFREVGSSGDIARSIHNLGYVAQAQGDYSRAAALFAESLALFQEWGGKRGIAECLAGLAGVVSRHGRHPHDDARRAARLLAVVEARFEAIGAALWPADRLEYERNVATVQAVLGQEDFATAWAEGRVLTVEEAIEFAGKIEISQ